MKKLSVRLYGKHIGILEQERTGKMVFSYDASADQAISLGMPIREESYDNQHCESFFGGLLPESEATKKAIGKQFGISYDNSFALLKAIGYDCAGAISFHKISEAIQAQQSFPLEGRIISEKELYTHIKELPKKPLFLGLDGLRLSLAGVQDKAAVCIVDGKVALPMHGCPTTHILKPNLSGFEGVVENEYLCLKIAAQIGLTVPLVEIRQINDISYLLIERYDRQIQNNCVTRIHQEDFCQALGVVSTKKYQNEGGPNFSQCFGLLRKTTQPAINLNMLVAGVVFNFLIGNMDAHGKNFSLLHKTATQISLAPFYDLICTQCYTQLSSKMAMKIGSKYQAAQVLPRHWEQFCENINYSYPALKRLIAKQGEAILKILEQKEQFLEVTKNISVINKIISFITKNINSMQY